MSFMSELDSNFSTNDNYDIIERSVENCEYEVEHNTPECRSNLFCIYSRVFRIMLANWQNSIEHAEEKKLSSELDKLILPSNEQWRHHVYYRLVDLQREVDSGGIDEGEEEMTGLCSMALREKIIDGDNDDDDNVARVRATVESPLESNIYEWEPVLTDERNEIEFSPMEIVKNISSHNDSSIERQSTKCLVSDRNVEPGWRLTDILLAANVLQANNDVSTKEVTHSDEAEMRRVYGLVYDVLRYKQILDQTLENANFWVNNPELRARKWTVLLLLYDMQGRKFTNHSQVVMIQERNKALKQAGLDDIEEALLKSRTKLAASVSRLRIGGLALTLGIQYFKFTEFLSIVEILERVIMKTIDKVDKLLPLHLRNEGVCWSDTEAVASGWVNTLKVPTKHEFYNEMSNLGLDLVSKISKLKENNYTFDPICPKVVVLHEKAREQLAKSNLVRRYGFIFLDRSLCLGAAALVRAIRVAHLCGPVILTHSIAPRHTGYLAGLLSDINEAGRLLAFGAGPDRIEHETYLENLGISRKLCRVFSENYSEAPGFAEMERATIVLAIPPCSYTGLNDIVDLAVARGGDTKLFETLTDLDDRAQLERPRHLLAEQMMSLKYALTRPNVQLLIYEAHSILPSETVHMLDELVCYANKMALAKYMRELLPRRRSPQKDPSRLSGCQSTKSSSKHASSPTDIQNKNIYEEDGDENAIFTQCVEVPDSDLFEVGDIFDFHGKESKTTDPIMNNGCYLAVVRRKEMMQFNSQFMIKVAESKGLFGDPDSKLAPERDKQSKDEQCPTKSSATMKEETARINLNGKHKSSMLDRIAAPTHSFLQKGGNRKASCQSIEHNSSAPISVTSMTLSCPRYSDRIARDEHSLHVQVCESRRQDIRNWWEQSANFLIHAARCESCKFRIFHTDPWTRRVLYPPKVQQIVFNDESCAG